jgi:hypothetical protein
MQSMRSHRRSRSGGLSALRLPAANEPYRPSSFLPGYHRRRSDDVLWGVVRLTAPNSIETVKSFLFRLAVSRVAPEARSRSIRSPRRTIGAQTHSTLIVFKDGFELVRAISITRPDDIEALLRKAI